MAGSITVDTPLQTDLQRAVRGEVRFDPGSRAAYATDSSNYRQVPLAVVIPQDVEDAITAIAVCARRDAPVVSRGGGTSLAGQTTNEAVVLDWTKHCNHVVSVDVDARTCVVEPGIALDDLNRQLAGHGLMFGPKPSTHRSCTLGGMIGNNSCGSTAQAYGKTDDNIVGLEVLTYDGVRMSVGPTSDTDVERIVAAGGRRAEIYQGLRRLAHEHADLVRDRFPDIPRRVSGYNLPSLLPEHGFDVARALVGSEGTLVTVLQAELQLVPVPVHHSMAVLGYPSIADAGDAVTSILPHEPWLLEGMDDVLLQLEKRAGLAGPTAQKLPRGGAWLTVQFSGDTQEEADQRTRAMIDALEDGEHAPQAKFFDDPATEHQLMELRESSLGASSHPSGKHPAWPGWEDAAVPPESLGDYLRDFRRLLDSFGYAQDQTSFYGHFGQGCIHTRIPFELRTADGIARYRSFVERAAELVASYGGSLSGEHGDGQARAELLDKMFGSDVVEIFRSVKRLFDPRNLMNPGKVVDPNPLDGQLRLGTDFEPMSTRTFFAYPKDDNQFSTVALRCVGVGNCRASVSDEQVMCPSYMVTREEEHSTRGRARLLFEMVRGTRITDGWRSTEVRDALDLCLACKGCKSDCPVNVDMATYKAEFLAHHYQGRVRPLSHYSMGWLPLWAWLARLAPRLVNAASQSPRIAPLLKRIGGIAPERDIPTFAPQRFVSWFARRRGPQPHPQKAPHGPVILWPDTFTNSFHPGVAKAAVQVLEDAGFEVRVPTAPLCCGLTWISTGQLTTARRVLARTVDALRDDIRAGVPIICLEPSCAAVFRSDGVDLLADDADMVRLAKQTKTLAELLTERAPDWTPPRLDVHAIVQTHCHQHAIMGTGPDRTLMQMAGIDAEQLRSGCCGLAGNFGFEAGHYDVSRAAGERVLLPRVRQADQETVVLADGFSCRTQIAQCDTGRTAMHLAELLASGLAPTPSGGRTTDQEPGTPTDGSRRATT